MSKLFGAILIAFVSHFLSFDQVSECNTGFCLNLEGLWDPLSSKAVKLLNLFVLFTNLFRMKGWILNFVAFTDYDRKEG